MSLLKDKIELEVELAELKTKRELDQFPKILRWVLIVSLLGIIPGYYIAKSISFRSWSKTYAQYLIKAKPSFVDAKKPSISAVTLTKAGNNTFSAVVKVINNNVDLAVQQADYEFVFQNAKGEKVYQESGTTFLLPNEEKYLIVPRINTTEQITSVDFHWTSDLHWVKRTDIPKINLPAPAPSVYNQFTPQSFVAEGYFTNNSPYQLGKVHLTFLILDQAGKILGASRRDEFTVAPNERRSYKQLWPNLYVDPNFKVKVFTETNILDKTNLALPDTAVTPASSLDRPSANNN